MSHPKRSAVNIKLENLNDAPDSVANEIPESLSTIKETQYQETMAVLELYKVLHSLEMQKCALLSLSKTIAQLTQSVLQQTPVPIKIIANTYSKATLSGKKSAIPKPYPKPFFALNALPAVGSLQLPTIRPVRLN